MMMMMMLWRLCLSVHVVGEKFFVVKLNYYLA
jgi:hypothetical protein